MKTEQDPVEEVADFIDDTCLRCDSYNIKMTRFQSGRIEYDCADCNYFWTNLL